MTNFIPPESSILRDAPDLEKLWELREASAEKNKELIDMYSALWITKQFNAVAINEELTHTVNWQLPTAFTLIKLIHLAVLDKEIHRGYYKRLYKIGGLSASAAAFHTLAAQFHLAIVEIRRMPRPVVAAINGIAAGTGFSLALTCDFRVMAQSAVLRQAYTFNGLCIDGGGTFKLPRLVGLAKVLEIAAFDNPISSEQAMN